LPALPEGPSGPGLWSAPFAGGESFQVLVGAAEAPRRGTAILVPPWKIRHPRAVTGYTRLIQRAGWESWLAVPPHHMGRTAPGARSGEGYVSLDLAALRRTIELQTLELRALVALASRRGPVALIGLSLGGLATALAATAPDPVDLAALVAPAVDLATVLAESGVGHRYRRLAEAAGAPLPTGEPLRALLTPLDPGTRRPTARRILVATGGYDTIVPSQGAERLARTWGAEHRAYLRGHITLLFACPPLRRRLTELLAPQ
jgi:predicted alpha/beta hydrolase family esterase